MILTFNEILYANVPYYVTVNNIINPMKSGGTGSFIVKTFQGLYVIDQNYIFGVYILLIYVIGALCSKCLA